MSRVLPILFNTDMVQEIPDGRKTVTRRVIKPQPVLNGIFWELGGAAWSDGIKAFHPMPCHSLYDKMPYHPGDILYVREKWRCWRAHRYDANVDIDFAAGGEGVRIYFAHGGTDSVNRNNYDTFVNKWFDRERYHPSIHMPKEAARIWLKVTDVRVERLQEITEEQAEKEGCGEYLTENKFRVSPKCHFMEVWDSTISKGKQALYGWAANPWVWVIEFERCGKPEEGKEGRSKSWEIGAQ